MYIYPYYSQPPTCCCEPFLYYAIGGFPCQHDSFDSIINVKLLSRILGIVMKNLVQDYWEPSMAPQTTLSVNLTVQASISCGAKSRGEGKALGVKNVSPVHWNDEFSLINAVDEVERLTTGRLSKEFMPEGEVTLAG